MATVSLLSGVIGVIISVTALLANFHLLILAAIIGLVGLLSGLTSLVRKQQNLAAWAGVVCSSLAVFSSAIIFGVGHGLR
jgi:hypothetical protein